MMIEEKLVFLFDDNNDVEEKDQIENRNLVRLREKVKLKIQPNQKEKAD